MTSDHDLLIEIRTKLDAALALQHDHERRLRHLERRSWRQTGAVSAIASSIGSVVSLAGTTIFGH